MDYYLFILIILFATAIVDLVVGVSNDAVNFLNSAVGSKAASRRTILIVASVGILAGATFSGGIMEVARKGIFNPQFFVVHDVMIIFLSVMITNGILLDLYNTFGLPTSTTVSVVFALLGGSVGIALIKVLTGSADSGVIDYINTGSVITIVSSIGLSIVFAFVFGSLTQFATRVIFTFDYVQKFRRYGGLYCASAITIMTYFILVKGAKGSTLLAGEDAAWIGNHLPEILGGGFLFWFALWQSLILFTRISVLKLIVLFGTFALALSFAANDLLNFIGPALAGLSAYWVFQAVPGSDPLTLTMDALAGPIHVSSFILLASGLVMSVTLWFSRKARSVTKTEVNLGRQEEGLERFDSSPLARSIVRVGIAVFTAARRVIPERMQLAIGSRIDPTRYVPTRAADGEMPSFDLLRAAVNLIVASALISFGTSLKLPLSTTFVTFMVAMSTSLADRSWGRENAVYRVNGVITVIGGWFFTALVAFVTSLVLGVGMFFGGLAVILFLILLSGYLYLRTARLHNKREAEFERKEADRATLTGNAQESERVIRKIVAFLNETRECVEGTYEGLIKDRRKQLKQSRAQATQIAQTAESIVTEVFQLLRTTTADDGLVPRYAQEISALQIIAANLNSLTKNAFDHIDNNHHPPEGAQVDELTDVLSGTRGILVNATAALEQRNFNDGESISTALVDLKQRIRQYDKNQIRRIRGGKSGTRQSLLFIGTMSKVERIADQAVQLVKLHRETSPADERSEALSPGRA